MSGVFDGGVFDIGVFDVTAAAADGTAPGSILTVTTSLIAGAAQTEAPPVFAIPATFGIGARIRPPLRLTIHAKAPGDLLVITARLIPGAAFATVFARVPGRALTRTVEIYGGAASIHVETPGSCIVQQASLTAGTASGFDAIKHDNDWLLLAA